MHDLNESKMDIYKLPTFGDINNECGMEVYNSCVGNNGYVDSRQYYDGYLQSAIKLMETICESKEAEEEECQYWIDTFVYPICFSIRHSIEILLKRVSETIIMISTMRKRKEDLSNIRKNFTQHDLRLIWVAMKGLAIQNDERYKDHLEKIEPFVLEMASVDPTGQTFRYAYSNDSVKHLTNVSIINIVRLYKNTRILKEDMKKLFDLNDLIYDEYCTQTFTKNMSRYQIKKLAEDLPVKSKWRKELNLELRKELSKKYSITLKELGKCIDIIKNHHEMAWYIGDEVPLQGIDRRKLFSFLKLYFRNNRVICICERIRKQKKYKETNIFYILFYLYNFHFRKKLNSEEIKYLLYSRYKFLLQPEFVAGLHSLYYYPSIGEVCEAYIAEYNNKIKKYTSIDGEMYMNDDLENLLLRKGDLLFRIVKSMKMLNQNSLIIKLSRYYGWTGTI